MEYKDGLIKEWKHKGRKCVILWVRDHFCAYVETKLKDVDYSQEFGSYETSPESNIDAHGGLTFSGELKDLDDGVYYFGCDYAHAGDYCEGLWEKEGTYKWTLKEVEEETNKMCGSIISYEKTYQKYKEAFERFEKEVKGISQDNAEAKEEDK